MKSLLKYYLKILRGQIFGSGETLEQQLTISQEWDYYAGQYRSKPGEKLGDEWNQPEEMGIDALISADQVVRYLDEKVFTPFLGRQGVILEIGSGGGRFTEALLPKCNKLIATDVSPNMLKLLHDRFKHNSKIDYRLLDGMGLSIIDDESIDAAFSYGVFVHIQHWDIFNYLSELNRVLKPGGKVILHHANTLSELGWKLFLLNVGDSVNKPKSYSSFTVMTPELIREFTKRAGLVLEKCLVDIVKRDCISLIRKS